ncbi:FAD-dependent oxidoreductase [Gulosibacter chungangensis]|uniref:FAD-dependent oxidoreductase n=1 Tax=Gulosibacter chungangensis TaxID=979746 RepID=UPI001CE40CF3|nr:FAD-dependent oxidoreductase [Gulosibacter chungangensis]
MAAAFPRKGRVESVKVWLRAKGRLPRFVAYSTQDAPLSVLKVEFYGTDTAGEEFTVAVGFGADASRLDATDVASVQDAVGRFGLDLQVTDVAAHDWNNDSYSMNTWAVFRPGQLTRELTSLQQSHGLLHFASGDIANLWAGHVDGDRERAGSRPGCRGRTARIRQPQTCRNRPR